MQVNSHSSQCSDVYKRQGESRTYEREALLMPYSATVFTAPLPADCAEMAFWAKFGFAAEGPQLVRRRTPDPVSYTHLLRHPAAARARRRLLDGQPCL